VPLHQALAAVLCLVFIGLAVLHFYWASGGRLGAHGAVPIVDDRALFTPGPSASAAVGLALIAAAIIAALRGGLLTLDLPARFIQLGNWVLVLAFTVRAVGDFRYVGFFKRVRGTIFARRDSLFYSPICALISVLAASLAVLAP
jgi:hypothetical protein